MDLLSQKIKDKLTSHFHEVLKTKTSPHSIALGFSIGTFIAVLPTPGFGVLFGLLVILLFKKVNKLALLIAFGVWNPVTLIPVYILSYRIGGMLFGSLPVVKYEVVLVNQAYNFTRRFLVGNILLALILSLACYSLTYAMARRHAGHGKKRVD